MSEQQLLPQRVVSGGQTGADQAGLIAARRFAIPTGAWMPKDFLTSTGTAPELAREFGLQEHTGGYADRTEANVRLADGTLRIAASFETLGEKCALKWLLHHGKPYLDIDRAAPPPVALLRSAEALRLEARNPRAYSSDSLPSTSALRTSGPRASPGHCTRPALSARAVAHFSAAVSRRGSGRAGARCS
jgi:hypothetical protein